MPVGLGDPWASYARTVVEIVGDGVGGLVVRTAPPGEVGEWPWPSPDAVHILTAWDPGFARPGDQTNRRRQSALEADLRPLVVALWPALGVDPVSGHREEGVAVRGSETRVLALGARYGQDAVFRWTPEEWTVVACTGGRRVVGLDGDDRPPPSAPTVAL